MSAPRGQIRLLPTRLPAHVLSPLVRALVAAGVTADMVTVVGVLGNVLAAYFIARGDLAVGGVVMLVASGLDMLDGAIARQTGRATPFGALFDSVLDRVSEAVVLFGVAWWAIDTGRTEEALLAFVALVGSLLVSYVRARAEGLGLALTDGLFRRQERVVLTGAGLLLGLMRPALWLLAVLSCLTAAQRLYLAGRALKLAEAATPAPSDDAPEEIS
ncbi:MAG: CDP-alcohol phosphatidyltransferase family protein [Dehalococcoidia bacterium]|nr:CDP-alcohol phosphatidyltransferase family protein [Dehalococcoidia bacterium]